MTHPPPPASGIENGLNTSWHVWNQNLGDDYIRAQRAKQESIVAQYWPQSPTFGPQGTSPASSALIMLVLSTPHANFKRNGVHPSTFDKIPHITTQWYEGQPDPTESERNTNFLGMSHIYPPPGY
jgi:hypothetical protein